MGRQVSKNDEGSAFAQGVKVIVIVTFISWCVHPVMWVLGAEGLSTISPEIEVGLICLADLVAKLGFGFYLLFGVNDASKPDEQVEGVCFRPHPPRPPKAVSIDGGRTDSEVGRPSLCQGAESSALPSRAL